jgi:hypothetical protein
MSRESGYLIDTFLVLDLAGLGVGHWSFVPYLQSDAYISQSLCPETSGVIVVINAPSMFGMMWSAFKVVLNARTLAKVKILSGKGEEHMKKMVSDDSLPLYLGGNFATPLDRWLEEREPLALYKECYVANSAQKSIEFNIAEDSGIKAVKWSIQTKDKDISFSVWFGQTEVLAAARLKKHESEFTLPEDTKSGVLTLNFDNTYSYWNGKTVMYKITLVKM